MSDEQSLGGNSSLYDEAQRAGQEDMEIEREFPVAIFTIRFWVPAPMNDVDGMHRYATAERIMHQFSLKIQDQWQKEFPTAGHHVGVTE